MSEVNPAVIKAILAPLELSSDTLGDGWWFYIGPNYLQIRFDSHHGRKWLLSKYMTKSEVLQTALKAFLTAVEHEAREAFRYRGVAIFGPHIDVEALVEAAQHEERRVG